MTIRAKILWIAFGITVLCTAVVTVNSYLEEKKVYLRGIDDVLRAAAYATPLILQDGFHDRITGPLSVTPGEHQRIVNLLTDHAKRIGVKWVYTITEYQGQFHEASSSGTDEDRAKGSATPFFIPWERPPASMKEAWALGEIRYAEYTDEWGRFRSIFIPMRTGNGTRFLSGADIEVSFIQRKLVQLLLINALLGFLVFLVVWLVSLLILSRILSPITRLTSCTRDLIHQEFQLDDEQNRALLLISQHRRDEIGLLADAFIGMQGALREYMENLRKTTAAKERIESELKIAHDIQMSLLKKVFPPFPQRSDIDLYAVLEPAKEVGGDLYDFGMVTDDLLYVCIADVSDKGVPAALFMAVTTTLLRRAAQQEGVSPAEILKSVNDDLAAENENLLFVTLFCGILNVRTGELRYSNAGHNPPLLVRAKGTVDWLPLPEGLVLGVRPQSTYRTVTVSLFPGDAILLYTDGVTEAMNGDRKLYSEERLLDTMRAEAGNPPRKQVEAILHSVRKHAGGAPQSDDVTILALLYRGSPTEDPDGASDHAGVRAY
jgi:sigma-B regulation protein RsbU (phosphoserine phosphatase)